MAKRPPAKPASTAPAALPATDYRHGDRGGATRKNNPPARIASEGSVPAILKAQYHYNPHLPPVLRFDQTGKADILETRLSEAAARRAEELLEAAGKRPLTAAEREELATILAKAGHARVAAEPWLEWTGKREKKSFEVDPVALHIHERVSAQAILKVAARQDVTRDLFADPEQEYHDAVQFYRHDVDWSNRLILGDSLQVMSSLARREDLAGKVQMIYMDPPYGIKFASNFQPEVGKRDVKDKESDLTREPEMVRAYRDTWHLGIHSYLSYLRDRLIVARELLADTGSIFVQISDENLHRVRGMMDEVFRPENFAGLFSFVKTAGQTSAYVANVTDHLIWFARDLRAVKFRRVFHSKVVEGENADRAYNMVELASGFRRRQTSEEMNGLQPLPEGARAYQAITVISQSLGRSKGEGAACWFPLDIGGRSFLPTGGGRWRTNEGGMRRMLGAERLDPQGDTVRQIRYLEDFPAFPISSLWRDTGGGLGDTKLYSVQTSNRVIERCTLMTTDPGDLVLDPTCGSGTTAYIAEQWGRRWITADTSRVAIAIARQRLLTAKFDTYKTRGTEERPSGAGTGGLNPAAGFIYKTVPHITLKSIAQNVALDPIFARHEPILDKALEACNRALKAVAKDLRTKLAMKLEAKQKNEGKKSVTDADRRRWLLPPGNREIPKTAEEKKRYTVDLTVPTWYHWEVPFDTDPDWPKELREAVTGYRAAWRAKMDEVNAAIAASAEQEELVDQPEKASKVGGREVVRVSGPFTVEAVQPPEMTLGEVIDEAAEPAALAALDGFAGAPDQLDAGFEVRMVEPKGNLEVANVAAYLDQMHRFLRADGVRFLGNQQMKWSRLDSLVDAGGTNPFHAEGRWVKVGEEDGDPDGRSNVAVAFGPQYGPITAKMVVDLVREANIRGYEHLVLAGFSFDGAAQTAIDKSSHPKVKLHMAHIRPDINPGMNGLLKEPVQAGGGQLFTVFGQPRIRVEPAAEKGMFTVAMEGVDIYNPVDDSIISTGASKVAAWFVDSDYDGVTFCITQAFFPDRGAWEKLAKALNGKDGPIDADRFEAFSGTTSLPFPAGEHRCVAVKVVDPRGNEVMAVEKL